MKQFHIVSTNTSAPDHPEGDRAPDAVSYKMRAECQTDAFLIRAALNQWVSSWSESWLIEDGIRQYPDMEVEFELAWNPPSLRELQWIISSLTDCHVAAETLMPIKAYTGVRVYLAVLKSMTRPPTQTRRLVTEGQLRTSEWLEVLTDAMLDTLEGRA